MADASHDELISQFTGVTGTNPDRAKFYLESAAWNLEVALSSFYDNGDADGDEPEVQEMPVDAPSEPARGASQPERAKPKITSLSNLRQDDSGDDSEEEGEAFYAGGSERSGQQVLGPPRKKPTADKLVDTMFKAAKEHGAETVEGEPSGSGARKGPTFGGAGYRLGEKEDEPSDVIAGADVPMAERQMDVVLKLWKNGFSVDSGPLRDYHDPANKDFLSSIHKGEIPRELIRLAKGGEVNLNMEDHRAEEFLAQKTSVKAFSGEGFKLGSPTPNVVGAAGSGAAAASGSGETDEASAKAALKVDASQPTTNLQIRLADGSRLVAKFNHSHTVGDVRTYITTARSQFVGANFVLMTTFPSKELSEETQTLADAKLLNAVLVQRVK